MILLLSSSGDLNLDYVIEWLEHYQYPYYRLNADDLLRYPMEVSYDPPRLVVNGTALPLEDIHAVWYRKFGNFRRTGFYVENEPNFNPTAVIQLQNEFYAFLAAVMALFRHRFWLTKPKGVSKLNVLTRAMDLGIKVPNSYITNHAPVVNRLSEEEELISKSVFEPLFLRQPNGVYNMFTRVVDEDTRESLPEQFFPSLVQHKVEKAYEVRAFYLDGDFYCSAIFSQRDSQTAVDFREYNVENPNRFNTYKLPQEMEEKLHKLMLDLDINCASLDIIRGRDGEYYFLEVNPTGQFGMVSKPCNYNLYKIIAEKLIKHDRAGKEKEISG